MSVVHRIWPGYSPPWFDQRWISTFYEAVGILLDEQGQRVMDGRLAGIPYAGSGPGAARLADGTRIECAPDALTYHASDRSIRLYSSEPVWSKRYRISRFRQLWADKGTHRGALRNAQPYFLGADGLGPLPTMHIVHESGESGTRTATWHKFAGGVPGHASASIYTRTKVRPSNYNFDDGGPGSAVRLAPAWVHDFDYVAGQEITNDGGKVYVCITAGTSASSGGPTGTASDITDGSAHWRYAIPWCRYWIFVNMSTLVTAGTFAAPPTFGDGFDYGEGNLYGEGSGGPKVITAQAAADLVDMLSWKSLHSSLWGVALDWHGVINPAGAPGQDADGRWSLPNGMWGRLTDPGTGKATRPVGLQWIYDRSQA